MTNKRHKTSGGQALVMVTLSLMAMAGLMGLAVDLGWSYFVQKEAQAAADGAALAAVQEAMINIRAKGIAPSAFACGAINTNLAFCQATPIACKSGTVTGTNLQNGCLYAKANGFDYTSSRQNVTIQSNDHSTLPPTAPGVNNITYWVTVRTVQTIPQLFSAVLGNTLGTVSAIGTAGVVGEVSPGSFYGMNRRGDCLTNSKGKQFNCGLDIQGSPGQGSNLQCGNQNTRADICAPKGIILASDCGATGNDGTTNSGCSNAYGGDGGNAGAMGSSLTMMTGGKVLAGTFTPSNPTPAPDGPLFQDQYAGISQPPLQVPSSPIGACGYQNGLIPANVLLGPYQYYSYTVNGGQNVPNGGTIRTAGPVTFSTSAPVPTVQSGCPGGGIFTPGATSGTGTGHSTAFPAYVFWGGLNLNGGKSDVANFGPGQYVMAGTSATNASSQQLVFNAGQTVNGDQTTGTMFVFTDGNYPGLQGQKSNFDPSGLMPTLLQGAVGGTDANDAFKNATINLSGVVGSNNATSALPPGLDNWAGIVWWQDRRNSTVGYDMAPDDGSVQYCNTGCADGAPPTTLINQSSPAASTNHVTYTSPQIGLAPGQGRVGLQGVVYQPRGAWMYINAGNSSFACTIGGQTQQCPLEVVTGALLLDNGTTGLLLAGPTNPIIKYKAALIQ